VGVRVDGRLGMCSAFLCAKSTIARGAAMLYRNRFRVLYRSGGLSGLLILLLHR
jgi:hypothetical protein